MESILNMLWDNIESVSIVILGFGGIGVVIKKYTGKVYEVIKGIMQVLELVTAVVDSLADGKVTKEEAELISKEFNDVKQLFNNLFGKKPDVQVK